MRLLVKRKGRNLRAEHVAQWTRQWFVSLGLHQLMGTIPLPRDRVSHAKKIIGEPCAGKPHARTRKGDEEPDPQPAGTAPLTTNALGPHTPARDAPTGDPLPPCGGRRLRQVGGGGHGRKGDVAAGGSEHDRRRR